MGVALFTFNYVLSKLLVNILKHILNMKGPKCCGTIWHMAFLWENQVLLYSPKGMFMQSQVCKNNWQPSITY